MKIAFCVAERQQQRNGSNLPMLLFPCVPLPADSFSDKALIKGRGKISRGIKNMIEFIIIKGNTFLANFFTYGPKTNAKHRGRQGVIIPAFEDSMIPPSPVVPY